MYGEIYWIPQVKSGGLAIMPRPRSGDWLEDEVALWGDMGLDLVVSLLTTEEVFQLLLQEEAVLCETFEVGFDSFPISDRDVPASADAAVALTARLLGLLAEGKRIAFHCRQGVGRSALMAACVLVAQGQPVEEAFGHIREARGMKVPDTDAQVAWLRDLAPALQALANSSGTPQEDAQ